MTQKKVLIFETSNTLKTAFKLALEGSEWKVEITSDPDLITVHMEAFKPDVVILEKKSTSSETLNLIKNSDVKMILSTASPENRHFEISRPFSTKELFEMLSENFGPDSENEEDIPEAEEVLEENTGFDTADEPLILDSSEETASSVKTTFEEKEDGFTQEDEPSINPVDEISENAVSATMIEESKEVSHDNEDTGEMFDEKTETIEDTESSLSEHLSKNLMNDMDEDDSEDEAYVAEIIEDDEKIEPESVRMVSEIPDSSTEEEFDKENEKKSDPEVPEFNENELVSLESGTSSDSNNEKLSENERINSIIKKELEKVIRDVFWEEAPEIIEDVIEKKLNSIYGEKKVEG